MGSDSSQGNKPGLTPKTLHIIRMVILGGVVVFGLAAWFVSRSSEGAYDEDLRSVLQTVYLMLLLVAGAGLFVLRGRISAAGSFQQRGTLMLVGYALAEAPALFGALLLYVTGSALPFLVGLLLLLLAFVMLPVPTADDA